MFKQLKVKQYLSLLPLSTVFLYYLFSRKNFRLVISINSLFFFFFLNNLGPFLLYFIHIFCFVSQQLTNLCAVDEQLFPSFQEFTQNFNVLSNFNHGATLVYLMDGIHAFNTDRRIAVHNCLTDKKTNINKKRRRIVCPISNARPHRGAARCIQKYIKTVCCRLSRRALYLSRYYVSTSIYVYRVLGK